MMFAHIPDSTDWVQIILAIISTGGVIVVAKIASGNRKIGHETLSVARSAADHAEVAAVQATQGNDAVNHKHTDSPRILDTVNDTNEVLRAMDVRNTAEHNTILSLVVEQGAQLVTVDERAARQIAHLQGMVADHVDWEMTQKYAQPQEDQ